jgi:hypothetical protein
MAYRREGNPGVRFCPRRTAGVPCSPALEDGGEGGIVASVVVMDRGYVNVVGACPYTAVTFHATRITKK